MHTLSPVLWPFLAVAARAHLCRFEGGRDTDFWRLPDAHGVGDFNLSAGADGRAQAIAACRRANADVRSCAELVRQVDWLCPARDAGQERALRCPWKLAHSQHLFLDSYKRDFVLMRTEFGGHGSMPTRHVLSILRHAFGQGGPHARLFCRDEDAARCSHATPELCYADSCTPVRRGHVCMCAGALFSTCR